MAVYPDKIFLIGFMGVGKSHWGRILSSHLGYTFLDLDEIVSRAEGDRSITEIFEQEGEEYFRNLESSCLEKHSQESGQFVMACGGGTPCFLNNLERMKNAGLVIWLQASIEELMPRLLAEKSARPLIKDLSDQEIESYIAKKLGDRQLFYREAHRTVPEATLTDQNLLKTFFDE